MNKKRVLNLLSRIFAVLLVLSEGAMLYKVWRLGMIPGKYVVALTAVLAVVTLILCLLMFRKTGKWEKNPRAGMKTVGYVLSLLIISGCLFGSGVIGKVLNTVSSITSHGQISSVVEVYVLSEDQAQSLQEAGGYSFGVSHALGEESMNQAVETAGETVGADLATVEFPSAFALVDGLYDGSVGAIFLDTSYLPVLEEMEGYSDFESRTRVIHQETVVCETTPQERPEADPDRPDPNLQADAPFLFYVSGNDSRHEVLANGGSDVNILAAVNPATRQILMVNTPRDYFVANPAGGGALDKLSLCGLYGIENSMETMEILYDQTVDYYGKINFNGFKQLVDAIGGINFHSDVGFTTGTLPNTTVYPGDNHLNGAQALAVARERKALPGGDNDRGKNQMRIIEGIVSKLSSAKDIIPRYAEILNSLEGLFSTSMPAEKIAELVKFQLSDLQPWEIYSMAVTGDNGHEPPYSQGGLYAYVMHPHIDEVERASGLLTRVLLGERLTAGDLP